MSERGFYVDVSEVPDTIFMAYRGCDGLGKWHFSDCVRLLAGLSHSIESGFIRGNCDRQNALLLLSALNDLLTAEAPKSTAAAVLAAAPVGKPLYRRRHRKLGPNVVDLVAKRREAQDREIVF